MQPVALHPNPILAAEKCSITIEARFWSKVVKSETCWNWIAAKDDNGYGRIGRGARPKQGSSVIIAPRLSWLIHKGEIPDGIQVHHSCDNPACVNPDHLWLGTQIENIEDMVSKKRGNRGEKNGLHKLTEEQVIAMRIERQGGASLKSLANKYSIQKPAVSRVVNGKRWAHI